MRYITSEHSSAWSEHLMWECLHWKGRSPVPLLFGSAEERGPGPVLLCSGPDKTNTELWR